MNHASLFTGIGGFDLAAQWVGWDNVFQVEIDPWCQRLLTQNFPNAKRYTDIKQFSGLPYRSTIDIISGGFPCQPYSAAGKRKGRADDRHLWPEMLRVVREVSPRWVVGENVRGLASWNGGVVFDEVQADLETAGYEVLPFLLPACGVNAPHRRERIWFVAYAEGQREREQTNETHAESEIRKARPELGGFGGRGTSSNADSHQRSEGRMHEEGYIKAKRHISAFDSRPDGRTWQDFPSQSPVCGRDDGIPHRLDRLKGLGNAVVPQVVLQIFKAINNMELLTKNNIQHENIT